MLNVWRVQVETLDLCVFMFCLSALTDTETSILTFSFLSRRLVFVLVLLPCTDLPSLSPSLISSLALQSVTEVSGKLCL